MSKGWNERVLGELFQIENGFAFKSADFQHSGIPVIKIKNIKSNHFAQGDHSYVSPRFAAERPTKVARRGDLLISMSGNRHDGSPETWVGKVAPFNEFKTFLINQRVGALRPKEPGSVNARFFGYLLSSWSYQRHFIAVATSSGGQANLSPKQILGVPVSFPPILEQRAIAATLGALDDKIELNRKMNETLEAMARALFRDWFVDFGPTRAKIEGRPAYLAEDLWSLFPDRLDEEGKPEGWEIGTIGSIAYVVDCPHSKKPIKQSVGRPMLQLSNVQDDGLLNQNDQFLINENDYSIWTKRIELSAGDCVITNVGRVGAVSRIPDGFFGALGRNMTAIRCKPSFQSPTFLIECLLSEAMRTEIGNKTDTGTILNALNVRNIPNLQFILPPTRTSHAFEVLVAPIRERMEKNLRECASLAQTRDLLLPRLMSGALRIQGAEQIAEETH